MKKNICTIIGIVVSSMLFMNHAEAKVWRVNNTAGIAVDFNSIQSAVSHASVIIGDTLYVEGSAVSYGTVSLNKRLVIIGPGYFLSGPNGNAGLQFNTNTANVSVLGIDSLASGSTIIGMDGSIYLNYNVDNITVQRSYVKLEMGTFYANSRIENLVINKCYTSINLSGASLVNPQVTNCIIYSWFAFPAIANGLIRNNTVLTSSNLSNSYVSNNLFHSNINQTFTNCSVKYNIAEIAGRLPAGNNNQSGFDFSVLVAGGSSSDGYYAIPPGSPLLGAGEPLNGVTPAVGAFGTDDPYRLSGIPAIPSIYSLTVPSSVPAAATSMTVTVSTRSNN